MRERCDAVRAAALRGTALSPEDAEHVASCAACAAEAPGVATLCVALAATPEADAPTARVSRVLAASAPYLAAYAAEHARAIDVRRPFDWARLGRALVPAVLVLPLLIVLDIALLRGAHDVLATILPAAVTKYIVASYALLLVALAGLAFGAIPLLVERQNARVWKEGHV